MDWKLRLRGGAFAGTWDVDVAVTPAPVMIAWHCGEPKCEGHFTFNPAHAGIVLERAVAYTRTELDEEQHFATYELGDVEPGQPEELEALVGIGAGAAGGVA